MVTHSVSQDFEHITKQHQFQTNNVDHISTTNAKRTSGYKLIIFATLIGVYMIAYVSPLFVSITSIFGSFEGYRDLEQEKTDKSVCFITCNYGNDILSLDRTMNVAKLRNDPDFHNVKFFLFTNIRDLPPNGWNVIVKEFEYRRHITQSRWGKFMGWKYPDVAESCHTIYYMDAIIQLRRSLRYYIDFATKIHQSELGLAQSENKGMTIIKEFALIKKLGKDVKRNIDASMRWLRGQNDFNGDILTWGNAFFGYDPTNPNFQKIAEFFWSKYSMEKYSWRDQPLWGYTIHHFNMTPMPLDPGIYKKYYKRRGKSGHKYADSKIV